MGSIGRNAPPKKQSSGLVMLPDLLKGLGFPRAGGRFKATHA